MLKVIVIEKDTLQVVDNYFDGTVGSIPDLIIIGTSRCSDSDMNMILLKIRDANLRLQSDIIEENKDSASECIADVLLRKKA